MTAPAPAPEKAAPIPAEVVDAVVQFILSSRGLCHEGIEAMVTAGVQAGIKLADREARPSLPDSREERDSPANLAKRVLAMREHLRHERADGVDLGTLTVVARTLTAVASADRARARQGGNNG